MNALICAAIGGALAFVSVIGGVSAVQEDPHGVSSDKLFTYADK